MLRRADHNTPVATLVFPFSPRVNPSCFGCHILSRIVTKRRVIFGVNSSHHLPKFLTDSDLMLTQREGGQATYPIDYSVSELMSRSSYSS